MASISRAPSELNCKRQSTYLTDEDIRRIDSGEVTTILIYDQLLDATHEVNAMNAKNALLDQVRVGDNGNYRCFNWGPFYNKIDKTPSFTHFTQTQVADMLGVDANRICELHRFNFLQPISKISNALFYAKEDVLKAMKESRVQFWIKSLKGN